MSRDLDSVRIRLASPDDIRSWSTADVLNGEFLNPRSGQPVPGGLFCEDIFGELTDTAARRERMSHIELAAPVVHPLFFRSLARLLGMKRRALLRVVYFDDSLVRDPGATPFHVGQQLTHDELEEARQRHGAGFTVESGAAAIQTALLRLDLPTLAERLRTRPRTERRVRRLRLVEDLLASGNRPEWLILEVIPVVPPGLRPLGRSDLNELYRRIILRNGRLRKLNGLNAPPVIIRNEMRMLQQCVDALFDNASCLRPVRTGRTNRPLRSLLDSLASKLDRPGKRVDYSARSVVVPGPELQLHQCGLPKSIALELYRPFLLRALVELDHANNVESAWQLLARPDGRVWDALVVAMRNRPVLLSRPPVRDRLGIQAFEPVLIEGNAIRIHPLVCKGFNADFDGDQMAVHLPLSIEAQVEATALMMSTSNIFSPANGNPIISPARDVVLGCYYLTATHSEPGKRRVFASSQEVGTAHAQGKLDIHAHITVRLAEGKRVVCERVGELPAEGSRLISTTVGRVLFNDILHDKMAFYDLPMTSKNLARIIADCQEMLGRRATTELLDRMKTIGFREATRAGLSLATDDLRTPGNKERVLAQTEKEVNRLQRYFEEGDMTEAERYRKCIDSWMYARDQIAGPIFEELRGVERFLNPLYLMVHSGACGSLENLRHLTGMRGLVVNRHDRVLETPIKRSLKEGLGILEYFLSLLRFRGHLHTRNEQEADARSLTRKLARAAQNAIVTQRDCGTTRGIPKQPYSDNWGDIDRPLADMLAGRISRQTIRDPQSGRVVVQENEIIMRAPAHAIENLGLDPVLVRSPMTCQAPRGVCQLCYGRDPRTGAMVEVGTAVGVVAAQSLGEPGAQLTRRTFHIGGGTVVARTPQPRPEPSFVAGGLSSVVALFEARIPEDGATLAEVGGIVRLGERTGGKRMLHVQPVDDADLPVGPEVAHPVPSGKQLQVNNGDRVERGDRLVSGALVPRDLLRILGPEVMRSHLVRAVQRAYRADRIEIDDRHIETIVASLVREKSPGVFRLLGMTEAVRRGPSFLAALMAGDVREALADAALRGSVDRLTGLTANVLAGRLIPAGTGFHHGP